MFAGWLDNLRSAGPIGLDLGSHSVRLLQIEQRRDGSSAVLAAASAALPPDVPETEPGRSAAIGSIIAGLLASAPFVGRKVVSALPAASLIYKNIRLPRMPEEELAAAVAWEATDRLKLGQPGELAIQYFNAGEVRQGDELRQEVILMAARADVVEAHLQMLLACGLEPLAIDAVPASLARWADVCVPPETQEDATFVLDVGHAGAKILVLRQGRVAFLKFIDIGAGRMDRAVADRLGLTSEEAAELRRRPAPQANPGEPALLFGSTRRDNVDQAIAEALRPLVSDLVREVGLCLRYYSVTFRGQRPSKALLVGGGAADVQLSRTLTEELGLAVDRPRLFSRTDLTAAPQLAVSDGSEGLWATAFGLAIRPHDGRAVSSARRLPPVQGAAA